MKLYFEDGTADGLKPADFMANYPQFDKYNHQSLHQSIVYHLLKSYKKKVKECGTHTCESFFLSLSHYFTL